MIDRAQTEVDLAQTHAQCLIWTWNLRVAYLKNDEDKVNECMDMLDALEAEADYLDEKLGVDDE